MNQPLRLLFLVILTGAMVLGLCAINPTRSTSVDSAYYLQSATNLLNGRGYVLTDGGRLIWNGVFPIGYSALIALASLLTSLPVLWSSKLVNLLALGLSAFAWAHRLGTSRALWVLSVWWLGGFLKILTYTWSETVFLVLLAEWVWCLFRFLPDPTSRHMLRLFLVSCALFLVRYLGAYVMGLAVLLVGVGWWKRPWLQQSIRLLIGQWGLSRLMVCTVTVLTGIRAYFFLNNHLTGSPFGGDRLLPTEPASALARLFGQSLVNELLLIRDFVPNQPTALVWVGVVLQASLTGLLYYRWKHHTDTTAIRLPVRALSRLFILTGLAYVPVLFFLRVFSPFSGPNLRLMAPATFCLLTAGLLWISASARWRTVFLPVWLGLLVCSWLQLLPQVDLADRLPELWRGMVALPRQLLISPSTP